MAKSAAAKKAKIGRKKGRSKQDRVFDTLARRLEGERQASEFLARQEEHEERKKLLAADPVFDHETVQLLKEFQSAYSYNPEPIDSFLRSFPLPVFLDLRKTHELIGSFPQGMQKLLKKYVRYASRFGAYFVRRGDGFQWRAFPSYGWKFHVKQENGRLQTLQPVPDDDEAASYFESPNLSVPKDVQDLLDTREAKYVQIDDAIGNSLLNDLEKFAYLAEGVTLIRHDGERPYLFCLFGEKASKQLLDRVGKAVSAFQRESYGRGKGGRPPNLEKRKKTRKKLANHAGRLKEVAAAIDSTDNIASAQSYVSRHRKKSVDGS